MIPERHPPYAPEAEISVLGAMLIDNDAVPKALEIVDESMFYREQHKRIFRAMEKLFAKGEVIDPITISEAMRDAGELESNGGMAFLAELLDAVPTAANVEYHAKVVRDRAMRRRLIGVCGEAIQQAHAPGDIATEEVFEDAQSKLYAISTQATADSMIWVRKSLMETFEAIEQNQQVKGGITGVPSGFADLDHLTGGWQKTDLILLAARPAMGKTACAVGFALHAALSHQVPVAIFSLEMSTRQLNQRMLCHEALVDLSKVLRGGMSDDDYVRMAQAAGHLNAAPIAIDDRGGVSPNYIRSRARRLKSECPDLGLILVDYMQMINGTGENENERITHSSKTMKEIAKELDVPMIACAQLNRANEARSEKRPQLSDLRGSGSLEQDADIVMFLHRPEYYVSPTEAQKNGWANKAELIVAKQRNGPTDTVELYFRKENVRFENYAEESSWKIPT